MTSTNRTSINIQLNKSNSKERMLTLFCTVMLFFIVFSIHLNSFPSSLTPRILTMAVACIVSLYINRKVFSNLLNCTICMNEFLLLCFFVFQLFYTWMIIEANNVGENASTDLSATFNFFISVLIIPKVINCFFSSTEYFCKCLVYATMIQSLIVILSFVFPSVRVWLESIQSFTFERYSWRIVGLGIAGAGGSVYLCCGLIANTYILKFAKSRIIFFVSYFINLFSIMLVGRTGFYVAIVLLAYLIVYNSSNIVQRFKTNLKMFGVCIAFIVIVIASLYYVKDINLSLFQYTTARLFEISKEDNTLKTLIDEIKTVPPISLQTLVGTGIVRGTTSTGLYFWHDSGYIKRYASIGLIFAIISYIAFIIYIKLMIKNVEKKKKNFIWLCILLLYIIEFKEPFMFMLAYPFTMVMMGKLISKENDNNAYSRLIQSG